MAKLPYLIERAKREGTPLLDGRLTREGTAFDSSTRDCHVTFVRQGDLPPALTGDFVFWASDANSSSNRPLALEEIEPLVWAKTLTFPRDAYVEYVFLKNGKRVNDPFNLRTSPNGIGGINNYFYAPKAHPTPFLIPVRNIPHGQVTSHTLDVGRMMYGSKRKIHLYQPSTNKRVPLLVALDGGDYLRRAKLAVLLDNLIAQNKIAPLAVAMVETTRADKGSVRMSEYACNELTPIFLLQEVVPLARTQLQLVDWKKNSHSYGIMGASMSGLMALYTALRAPEMFGTVISYAGAFDLWNQPTPVWKMAAEAEFKPRVWLDVGKMDWLLRVNRRMFRRLGQLGFDVKLREYYAFHNWIGWRNVLPEALMWAFGTEQK